MGKALRLSLLVFIIFALTTGLENTLDLTPGARADRDYSYWMDQGIVYTAPSGDAYYPSVLYDSSGFGYGSPAYRMWYSDGSGALYLVQSSDGLNWGLPQTLTGLGGDAHHAQVLYDAACFGASPCDSTSIHYQIWYWDIDANLYSISAIAHAGSSDGVSWSSDDALTQDATRPLVTGGSSGWNRGSYGPVSLFYQAGAPNSGSDPWDYSYVMYYDGTNGSQEVTGLAYSSDGLYWSAYSSDPVLDKSPGNLWDCDDSVYGTVYLDSNGFHFWYSGGGGDNGSGGCAEGDPVHEGFGYAASTDGLTWTKSLTNPIYHISQNISYRNRRVYTPAMVDDGSGILRLYYTAQATGSGQPRKIGLALNPTDPTSVLLADFRARPYRNAVLLEWSTTLEVDLSGFNLYRANEQTGELERMNEELLPARLPGGFDGASYSFLDHSAQAGVVHDYWLESVGAMGMTERFGPVRGTPGYAVYLPYLRR